MHLFLFLYRRLRCRLTPGYASYIFQMFSLGGILPGLCKLHLSDVSFHSCDAPKGTSLLNYGLYKVAPFRCVSSCFLYRGLRYRLPPVMHVTSFRCFPSVVYCPGYASYIFQMCSSSKYVVPVMLIISFRCLPPIPLLKNTGSGVP